MARETKAERELRTFNETYAEACRENSWRTALPMKVMEQMVRATQMGLNVTLYSMNGTLVANFIGLDPDNLGDRCQHVVLTGKTVTAEWELLSDVVEPLNDYEAVSREKNARDTLRRQVLSRLTPEERAALGV